VFEQSTLATAPAGRRAFTAGLGFAGQAAFVAVIVLAPLIWPQVLPKPQSLMILLTPPVPSAPQVKTAVVKPRASQTPYRVFQESRLLIPTRIPPKAAMIEDAPPDIPGAIPGGFGSGTGDAASALLNGLLGTQQAPARPVENKPPDPKPVATEPKRIKVSSGVQSARLIHQVQPEYPQIARQTHVSGTVELTGIVGTDGRIRELKVLSGNPLLVPAAVNAVSQWVYAPTLLNGEAVEVVAPITVTFRLN
jgi:protein TonB